MAFSTISDERFSAFLEISVKYYSWETIMQECGITNCSDKGDQFEITCPFHDDRRPSLRLNKRTGVYHCFSCGRKGTYTKFLWEMQGKAVPYAEYCEQVLKANPAMQMALKFNSLFIDQKTLDPEFNGRRVFNRESHLGSGMPLTTLASKVRKLDDSWENLVLSLTLLQQGVSTEGIYATLQRRQIKVKEPQEKIGLMDLLGD